MTTVEAPSWHFTFATFVLVAWIPLCLLVAAFLSPRRTVIVCFVVGWLFLPNQILPTPFVICSKSVVVALGALAASVLLDPARIWRFRPRWFDVPMIVWCLVPMAANLSNSMSFYDAAAAAATNTCAWGVPYLLGRVYLYEPSGLKQMALLLVAGGLIYVPLCLWEAKMSPTLHRDLYQFDAIDNLFVTSMRLGGWRPVVFLQTGLALGMFMTTTTLTAVWLWWTGAARDFLKVPMGVWALALLVTTLLCRSLGAITLLGVGLAAMLLARRLHSRVPIFILSLAAPAYLALRIPGLWSGAGAVSVISDMVGGDRGQSLEFRMDNEDKIAAHALEQPLLGWGRSQEFLLYDRDAGPAIPDGMWTIAMGAYGLIGLAAFFGCLLVPAWGLLASYSGRTWTDACFAAPAALSVVMLLYSMDSIMNAMEDPIFFLALGGLSALAARQPVAAEAYPVASEVPAPPRRRGKEHRPVSAGSAARQIP